ncbi:MAG TPA: FadR/GntR family transcriptional regulator [Devosiaceae bacterium]|jgi:DNA-binding FadR family transcriptional regulator|nr:FadR/GntR family transcriptional regulator [Devosiaceae bacterium]
MTHVDPTSTTPAAVRSPRHVTRQVMDELGRRILAGHYPQRSVLPTELQLCEEFGVSRTALREATKMLAAKGLVVARRRAGTIVQDSSLWNRLDVDVLSWMDAADPDPIFVRGLVEARLAIEPAAADLAAQRATASDLAVIEAGFLAMQAANPADLAAFAAADIEFHVGVLNASHNPVFTGLANLIGRALRSSVRLTTPASGDHRRAVSAHGEVLEAIRLRQPELARSRMRALIDIAALDLTSASVRRGG